MDFELEMMERLKKIIIELNLSQKDFAVEIGVTKAAVSDMLHGRVKKISGSIVEILKVKYNVNPIWLNSGYGQMYLEEEQEGDKKNSLQDVLGHIKQIIIAVEELLTENDIVLEPHKKADLILLVYEYLSINDFSLDNVEVTINKFLRLVG